MDLKDFVEFVRERGLAVVATRGSGGAPEAALVGITATDDGDLVFDTSMRSRKYRNIQAFPAVAVVVGWDDEVTVQCEGTAGTPAGADRDRCLSAYFSQYPDGRQRAEDPDITHIRVKPQWIRYSDYRPGTFGVHEMDLNGG